MSALFIVVANTTALWSPALLSPSFSLLSVVPCLSACDSVSYSSARELTWDQGRVNKQSASPLRRDREKTRWRGGGEEEAATSASAHPPRGSNETEGKKNRRRDAGSLTAQCKQNSPHPLLGPKPESAARRRCSPCQNLVHHTDVWEQEETPQKATFKPF